LYSVELLSVRSPEAFEDAKRLYIPFFVNVYGHGIPRITGMWMTTTYIFELEELSEAGTAHMKWV